MSEYKNADTSALWKNISEKYFRKKGVFGAR